MRPGPAVVLPKEKIARIAVDIELFMMKVYFRGTSLSSITVTTRFFIQRKE